MKKRSERLIVFFIGFPLVVLVVLLLPQMGHLAENIILIILSAIGSYEFAAMLGRKHNTIHPVESVLLGILGPFMMTLVVSFDVPLASVPIALIAGASWFLVSAVFSPARTFPPFLNRLSAGLSTLIYPGLFIIWVIRMNAWPHASYIVLVFLAIVLLNDAAAWATGNLFGANNKGYFAASPSKSLAGFAGGFAASIILGILAVYCLPAGFTPTLLHGIPSGIILGLVSSFAANVGDLAESVMKRSAEIKDSGAVILGRGGVLDSIDSLALTAPVYYVCYLLLFG
ncbi:phosphatidate cytidylyltransferase [Breznakiellaceae bacterium SP9]